MRGDEFFTRVASRPPFTKLHPAVAAFLKRYFANEKVVSFAGRSVVNTNFPPYPSPAFDQLAAQFGQLGDTAKRRLYSVTLAVTNRCDFNCWHCYNAGRSQIDLPLEVLRGLARELQDLGAVIVTLTGGEPLLRADLPDILGSFDERSCLVLGTTGDGLTLDCAHQLRDRGLFAVGISLDSEDEAEHDRMRGRNGAFRSALQALSTARAGGLYPYVVAVATREFLRREHFLRFLTRAGSAGALEVHLLEPSASGKLAGQTKILLTAEERRQIFAYQEEMAQRDDLPIVSSFAYLESPDAFGCGAGLTHLYIDGSGEVCPCNLVPLSFGNLAREPFRQILDRMGTQFCRPRTGCVGRSLARQFVGIRSPASPDLSIRICEQHLPRSHDVPAFFRLGPATQRVVGATELREAYNHIHEDYEQFWLTEASRPVEALVESIRWNGSETVFEAGCGTGLATAWLAARSEQVLAVDLSEAMLNLARRRLQSQGFTNVRFRVADALAELRQLQRLDGVFSSWVLGYIALPPFFAATADALVEGGFLAFIVHRDNSPREPLEIFSELVAEDPSVLQKQVSFDFPRDQEQVRSLLQHAGFETETVAESSIVFRYDRADQVLEHLLKSGAGTAFHDALDPARRATLTRRFLQRLEQRHARGTPYEVRHEYVTCLARKA